MSLVRSWNFALSRDKKLHISGHGGSVKVGVKKNIAVKKTVKKTKFMYFVLK